MTPRILVHPDQLLEATDQLLLNEQQLHYLGQVLRLRTGAALEVFDGCGGRYQARLLEITRKQALISRPVKQVLPTSGTTVRLQLVQGMARGDRMDWAIEKATEAGVASIMPLAADRSTVRLSTERARNRHAHWGRVAEAACRQCGQDTLPDIHPVADLDTVLAALRHQAPGTTDHHVLQLSPGSSQSLAAWAREREQELTSGNDEKKQASPLQITVIVGPESGFADREQELLSGAGVQQVGLGPRVMRTETAGVAALSILQALLGDLK